MLSPREVRPPDPTFCVAHMFGELHRGSRMDAEAGNPATPPSGSDSGSGRGHSWEYSLRKYLLLLATLVATVTYTAGFNPPGGVWQDADPTSGRIAGDPIIRDTMRARYLVFFYSNATAFASSLVVIVLILILSVLHDKRRIRLPPLLAVLRFFMVLDLLSLMAAYAAGTFRDVLTAVYSLLLLTGVVVYLVDGVATVATAPEDSALLRLRKVLMLLATFAVSVTYVAGLSAPGDFWDNEENGHKPGDAILKGGPHDARLKAFFVCNTTAFVASLLILIMLLQKKLCFSKKVRSYELYGFIAITLLGLVAAYSAGSCREIDTTVYVNALIGAVVLCIIVQLKDIYRRMSTWLREIRASGGLEEQTQGPQPSRASASRTLEKARSLVLLLATLAAAITYQAGLDPSGGLWQDDDSEAGHIAGDPILLTANPRRYKTFFYCNSVAFVASLVAIVLVRMKTLHHHNALEAAMVLDLFGLIGAYAAGSCRDVGTSIYAIALAGVVLVYVVIHVVFLTLDHSNRRIGDDEVVEKRRKRLLLFAILAATITYQAGLTPPSGFLQKDYESGHHAGDPVLLYNDPRRYKAFFYCNSVSFMLSIALIILLVNPNLYRPAIGSNALSVCTAAGMFGLIGPYAAGSTQHLKTSIYIFALAPLVLSFVIVLVAVFAMIYRKQEDETPETIDEEKLLHAKRKYLMLLGILVASVTYQAGLEPPGAVWQGGPDAGDPVMHDNQRPRYLAFFYCNSTSFVASIVVIILLLPEWLHKEKWWLRVMNTTIVLDLLGLLIAYAAGSSRSWKTTGYVSALVIAVLAYSAVHVLLSCLSRRRAFPAADVCLHPSPP
uniref:PGG domain-containing protein n=1 Tax=Setaria italica TaxID=4555 RepID=K3ZEJ7_SETIT